MLTKKLAFGATSFLVCAAAVSAAYAQSTGSTTVQEVVITGKERSSSGAVTAQEVSKTREAVTAQYIETQPPGMNVIQDLNLIPGVNYTNDDPFGMAGSGGHLRVRGIDGSRVSLLVDGVPLNDTGNYAIYPGELVDPEVVGSVNVNTGSTDVDSPTASAVGGLININTLTPTDNFGGFAQWSSGSFDYGRGAALINTGQFGPWGTKAWLEFSDQEYHKFIGYGTYKKWQINGKIYQDLHHEGDFIAIAGFWDDQMIPNLFGLDFAGVGKPTVGTGPFGNILQPGNAWNTDYPGTPAFKQTLTGTTYSNSGSLNFFGNEVNPTRTGNIRGQSRFTLLPNLKLTIDPSFQYVLADGGSQTTTLKGNDPRLIGLGTTPASANGKSPQGYTECVNGANQVTGLVLPGNNVGCAAVGSYVLPAFDPSLTNTHRITINSSLIWDIDPNNVLQLAYAYDHGHHRQRGDYTFLTDALYPQSPYGGFAGLASPILSVNGAALQRRDRLSEAVLNQVSLAYIGRFFDNHLRVDLGVRDPHFSRDLDQMCYTSTSGGSSVYCDLGFGADAAAIALKGGGSSYTAAPFKASVNYTKVLPNAGVTWRFDRANSVYFSYSEELSAPRTDDLYTVGATTGSTTVNINNVQPETSTTYELGYRYKTPRLQGTLDLYQSTYHNRIVSSFDQDTQQYDDRNVGDVEFYGAEGLITANPIEHLSLTGSVSYNHSEVMNNLLYKPASGSNPAVYEPLKGKQLAEDPEWMFGGRAAYSIGNLAVGVQAKWVDKRWVTDVNDLQVPSYIVWDADARYKLDFITKGTYLQLNVINMFDEKYFGSLNSTASNNPSNPYYSGPYAYQGAPRTVWATVRVAF